MFTQPLVCGLILVLCGMFVPEIANQLPAEIRPAARIWCADLAEAADKACLPEQSVVWRLFFSLDMLLPIVELSREHSLVQSGFDGLAYGWFVVQRLLGWLLALLLVAGITGLTK